jgi:mono/diheme cytochrome c family protein
MLRFIVDLVVLLFITLVMIFSMKTSEASEGAALYKTRCASCHNVNPTKPGSIGPDLTGSSLELITLKTQKRQYPAGYKPKRKTRIMPQIKLSEKQLKSLHEYINSFKRKK